MRKVKYKKGGGGEECASNENESEVIPRAPSANNEETKVNKTGNKRGRPRKHPNVAKDDNSQKQKSNRGRKPKKLYEDVGPIGSKIGLDVSFNDSENKDNSDDNQEEQEKETHENLPPFYPRKESMNNPFDKFFNAVPQNLGYVQGNRSRIVSSDLSPYNIPSNPPNFQSPGDFRGRSFNNQVDFKAKNMLMSNNNGTPQQNNEDNPIQKKLNEIIAQSFKNWNKPRKDTEDISFNANSIMSPDYKPRSFSINSNGWAMAPHNVLDEKRMRSGWDFDSSDLYMNDKFGGKGNQDENKNNKNGNLNEPRVIKISTFTRNDNNKGSNTNMRK